MREFMLLMRGNEVEGVSPEQMQKRLLDYMAWMKKMSACGTLKAGQPLEPTGRLLQDVETVLTDGPFLEAAEIIGGYVIVNANDLTDATEIARDCPLLNHCQIEVRPLIDIPSD